MKAPLMRSATGAHSPRLRGASAVIIGAGAAYAILGGVVTLIGWAAEIPRLTDWGDDGVSMFVNAAVCAILCGAALALLIDQSSRFRVVAAQATAAVAGLIGGLTLLEHVAGVNLGIDTLLLTKEWGQAAAVAPMRMGPPASTSFLVIGAALVLATGSLRARRIASGLAWLPVAVSLLSITGYWFRADQLFILPRATGIAWQTSTILAVLGLATMAAVPERGVVAALRRKDSGGSVLRRLIVPVVVLPFLLGWLQMGGRTTGLYDASFGTALRTLVEIGLLLTLLWWTSNDISAFSQAAKIAQARLAAIVEWTSDAVVSVSLDGVIESWNDGARRLFGYTADEMIGRRPDALLPPDRKNEDADLLKRISESELIEHFETVRLRKDGSPVNISLSVSPIRNVAGTIVGASKIARDVTERKRIDQQLLDQTHTLELLHQTGIVVSSTLDLHELLQGVTDVATQLSGAQFGAFYYNIDKDGGDAYSLYTLSGASRQDFQRFDMPRATPLFGRTFKGEGPIRSDDILQDPRYGQTAPQFGMPPGHLPVRSYLAVPVVSRDGVVLGGLFFGHPSPGVFNEKTERLVSGVASQAAVAIDNAQLYERLKKAAEERQELLEAERAARGEAERLNLMKDEFLATLSHELRTPLTAILGWSQLLSFRDAPQEELTEGLEAIQRNAQAQTQLIDDLLDMSRIISGKLRLDVQQTDVTRVVEQAVASVRPSAEAKQIALRRIVDPHPCQVSGDPTRLQQVFWNLLTNAVKFTPQGGAIDVKLQQVDSHIEFTVHDSGVGIKPEFLPQVFERFRQADSSSTRSYGGLGLGLSIVKNLVEMHGGSVSVDSAGEGQGATFTVCLPLAPPRATVDRERPLELHDGAVDVSQVHLDGVKVLVVDDDRDARELLGRVLRQCRAQVTIACSAAEGLAAMRAEKPDVLVSDIGMPETDGYDFIRQVRMLPATAGGATPAIALTAFARSIDRTRAMLAGYQVHISKPIEPRELIATVSNLAGRQS